MSKSVFCLATDQNQAERIVQRLQGSGFTTGDISVLHTDSMSDDEHSAVRATKATEGVTKGATAGGLTGGAIGLLAGIGALAIPGLGAFIAAGPMMAALSGVALGATAGGVVGGLIGMGLPEDEARRYEEKVKRGHFLISAHAETSSQIKLAKQIFEAEGAGDVSVVDELKPLHS